VFELLARLQSRRCAAFKRLFYDIRAMPRFDIDPVKARTQQEVHFRREEPVVITTFSVEDNPQNAVSSSTTRLAT